MDKISVDEAKKAILEKLDEIYDLVNRIDYERKLMLSVTIGDDYKRCALVDEESIGEESIKELFYVYAFPASGFNSGWDK